jgi:hypothetical protein
MAMDLVSKRGRHAADLDVGVEIAAPELVPRDITLWGDFVPATLL